MSKKTPTTPTQKELLADVLKNGTPLEIRTLFNFDYTNETKEVIQKKFKLFARAFFSRYFQDDAPPFHHEMISNLINSYFGQNFLNLAFRLSAKTTLTKLFLTFVILNDTQHFRKYIKVLSKDGKNPKQIVTDIYNMCVEVRDIYGDVFEKDNKDIKREERMDSFTMRSGVKLTASTVGQTQRGNIQDAYRPDYLIFDDIEDSESVRSQAITESIILTVEEAITGLAFNGSWTCLGNYISEYGVIQHMRNKKNKIEMITPIATDIVVIKGEFISCKPTWSRYSEAKIKELFQDTVDFFGEYCCDPVKSEGKFFDMDLLDSMMLQTREPYKIENGVKYFVPPELHHRYGMGADTSEGIGKDSSALCVFDFRTGEVVATFHDNKMPPELFAYTLAKVGREYNNCVIAPEINNLSGGMVISTLKEIYPNIYRHIDPRNYSEKLSNRIGWYTTSLTKTNAFMDFRKALNDRILKIYDRELLQELRSYSQSDLAEKSQITRHFDITMACFVKNTMVLTDRGNVPIQNIRPGDMVMTRQGYRKVLKTSKQWKPIINNIGLTGTSDHPIILSNNEIKPLLQVDNSCDILVIWNHKKKIIENLSYTEAQSIIDTQNQNLEVTESILWEEQNGKNQPNIYIAKFGKIILEKSQKVLLSIIKIVIRLIIRLKIYKRYRKQNTTNCICQIRTEDSCQKIYLIKKKTDKKHWLLEKTIIQTRKIKKNLHVLFAKLSSYIIHIMPDIVLQNVKTPFKIKKDIYKKQRKNVLSVKQYFLRLSHGKSDVLRNAQDNTGIIIEPVYNLEVEEVPEYFANNILVHNCVIGFATQYNDQSRNEAVIVQSTSAIPNITMDNPFGV